MLSYMYPPIQDAGVLTIPVMVPIIPIIFPRLLGGVTSATNACHAGPPITPIQVPRIPVPLLQRLLLRTFAKNS